MEKEALRIKTVMEKNGMSVAKAAKQLGRSRQYVHRLVRTHFDVVKVLVPKKL